MKYSRVDRAKEAFPVHRLCEAPGVSQSGHLAWKSRPARQRQRQGMVLLACVRARFRRATDREHAWPVAPDLLEQGFTAARPDETWGADISYVWTREGWPYLAVIVDAFARRFVGWRAFCRIFHLCRPLAIPCFSDTPAWAATPKTSQGATPNGLSWVMIVNLYRDLEICYEFTCYKVQ